MSSLKMRDLVFKNLTSEDKKKKILQARETISNNGTLTKIQRGFVCLIKPMCEAKNRCEEPEVYITKLSDTKLRKEKLLLKIKGGLYAVSDGRLYFLSFCHSLKINIQKEIPAAI